MLKLMKYELIKQKNTKYILGGMLLLAELVFLYGILRMNDGAVGLGIVALSVLSICILVGMAVEAMFTYYSDMKNKQGYMLFMTPYSEYTILGSKLIAGFLNVVVWVALVFLLAMGDMALLVARFEGMEDVLGTMQFMIGYFFNVDISWTTAFFAAVQAVLYWAFMVTSAFLAITISTTLLVTVRGKGVISFVLYVVFDLIVTRLVNLLTLLFAGHAAESSVISEVVEEGFSASVTYTVGSSTGAIVAFVVYLVACVGCFLGTGALLNKKLSL